MGIIDDLFGKKPQVNRVALAAVVPKLVFKLEIVREQFVFGSVTALKSEGALVAGISPISTKGVNSTLPLRVFN